MATRPDIDKPNGGHAIDGCVRVTHDAAVNAILRMHSVFWEMGIEPRLGADYAVVGSVARNAAMTYGDLDVAIRKGFLLKALDLGPQVSKTELLTSLRDEVCIADRRITKCRIMSGLNTVSFGMPTKLHQETDEEIQVDLMVSNNLEWHQWMYHSPIIDIESRYKGLYRNIALAALLSHMTYRRLSEHVTDRLLLNFSEGVYHVEETSIGISGREVKVPRVLTREWLYDRPDVLTNRLFGTVPRNVMTFEDVVRRMDSFPAEQRLSLRAAVRDRIGREGYPLPGELE